MTKPWLNPSLSLGLRCVLLAQHEMDRGVRAAPYGQPNTSEDVERYLAPCVRDLDNDGQLDRLNLRAGNWCAAFVSWQLRECAQRGEQWPHEYRAGVVEIVADARAQGRWYPVADVRSGHWTPRPGDLLIWDRSEPGRRETSWWRHVNRLVKWDEQGFVSIGGNEGRKVQIANHPPKRLSEKKLLGFVSYEQHITHTPQRKTDDDLKLIAAFVQHARQQMSLIS